MINASLHRNVVCFTWETRDEFHAILRTIYHEVQKKSFWGTHAKTDRQTDEAADQYWDYPYPVEFSWAGLEFCLFGHKMLLDRPVPKRCSEVMAAVLEKLTAYHQIVGALGLKGGKYAED